MKKVVTQIRTKEEFDKIINKITSLPKSSVFNINNSEDIISVDNREGYKNIVLLVHKDNEYLCNFFISNEIYKENLEELKKTLSSISQIFVVKDNIKLLEACSIIEKFKIIALDTETYPYKPVVNGIKQEKSLTMLSLMQLCVSEQTSFKDKENKRKFCFIFDFMEDINIDFLKHFLVSEQYIKIFHNARYDVDIIQSNKAILLDNIWCTMISEKLSLPNKKGFKLLNLAKRHLSLDMDKTQQQSEWHLRPLSEEQFIYSILDSTILLDIYYSQKEKEYQDGWYYRKGNKNKNNLFKTDIEEHSFLEFIDPDEDKKEIDWLRDFIISGEARSFQPSQFCLKGIYHVNDIYDFSQDLLVLIMNTGDIESVKLFNNTYSIKNLLMDLYDFCNLENRIENKKCNICESNLYDIISIETLNCYRCRNKY